MKLKRKMFLFIFVSLIVLTSLFYKNPKNALGNTIENCNEFISRLNNLEPEIPKDIQQHSVNKIPMPSKILPITYIINKGTEIKLDFAYNDSNWIKPTYKTYWHSTVSGGRWSYVPNRINYSLHDIFTTYPTASIYYDFIHNLGIQQESKAFKRDSNALDTILLVVMDSNVKKIMTLGNQVVVIVEPTRSGLQVLEIPDKLINLTDKKSTIIFQLVTPDGYELDYSLIYKNKR